jgi:flavodoxin
MRTIIVYDSVFGNTADIARAIAAACESAGPARLVPVAETGDLDLSDIDLLIVGSPTRGFNATPAINEFLSGLPQSAPGLRAAAFDTRMAKEAIHPAPLRWVVEAGGYAAQRIAHALEGKGFALADTAGFEVTGQEGPLKPDELAHASAWAHRLAA